MSDYRSERILEIDSVLLGKTSSYESYLKFVYYTTNRVLNYKYLFRGNYISVFWRYDILLSSVSSKGSNLSIYGFLLELALFSIINCFLISFRKGNSVVGDIYDSRQCLFNRIY